MPPSLNHPEYQTHCYWMERAIALAKTAGDAGEIPVGAVIVNAAGDLIAEGENRRERDCDPTAHAEILVLRQAGSVLNSWRLQGCTLYVTLEPCPMCAGAIIQSRITTIVYGVDDPKTGALRTVLNLPDGPASNHSPEVWGGILESSCRHQLQSWFNRRRQ